MKGAHQLVMPMCDYQQTPETASEAARWIANKDGTVRLEDALNNSGGESLGALGHSLASAEFCVAVVEHFQEWELKCFH